MGDSLYCCGNSARNDVASLAMSLNKSAVPVFPIIFSKCAVVTASHTEEPYQKLYHSTSCKSCSLFIPIIVICWENMRYGRDNEAISYPYNKAMNNLFFYIS